MLDELGHLRQLVALRDGHLKNRPQGVSGQFSLTRISIDSSLWVLSCLNVSNVLWGLNPKFLLFFLCQ